MLVQLLGHIKPQTRIKVEKSLDDWLGRSLSLSILCFIRGSAEVAAETA